MIRIAVIDLYEGQPNQGMRCLRQIVQQWKEQNNIEVEYQEFELRLQQQIPDMSFDIYISSGGPGSPLDSEGSEWEKKYFHWLSQIENWNTDKHTVNKKFVFFI